MSDAYVVLLDALNTHGIETSPRNKDIKELIDVTLKINDNEVLMSLPGIRDITNATTKEARYFRAEFIWYMSGSLETQFISKFGSMWSKLVNKFDNVDEDSAFAKLNTRVNSNYGYHVFHKVASFPLSVDSTDGRSMFYWVCDELNKDRDSRKAIIQYTWPIIYNDGVNDFTCTQNQHFLIRNGELINIVNIRSSDAIKGLTFDIPWWDIVGQLVANATGSTYNKMVVHINSSHYYKSDDALVSNILNNRDKFEMKQLKLRACDEIQNNLIETYLRLKRYYSEKFEDTEYISHWLNDEIDFDKCDIIMLIQIICLMHVTLSNALDEYEIKTGMLETFNNMIFDSIFTCGSPK